MTHHIAARVKARSSTTCQVFFFRLFGVKPSLGGWAWNVSGAKSVGGKPMIRIASIQSAWARLPTIWFDSRMGWDWATHIRGVGTNTQRRLFFPLHGDKITKNRGLGYGVFLVFGGAFSLVALGEVASMESCRFPLRSSRWLRGLGKERIKL
ncbi:hypothetical protein LY76DRAFT_72872 [Colletotrichum caudatum]|nr:hypothetical protein LY76DRAFT_72872 [Colletotrichum caudatum]